MLKRAVLLISILFLSIILSAHGDLHERIKLMSEEIRKNPNQAELYVRRGKLYIQHEEYKRALKDYKKSKKLGIDNDNIKYNIAFIYYKMEKYHDANKLLDIILNNDNQHVHAYRLKGKSLLKTRDYELAGLAFENVIEYAVQKLPENYFETSYAFEQCKSELLKCKAYEVIESGIEELGGLRTFYDRLIELHNNNKDFASVLFYQNKIIEQSNRKERAYYNRGLTYLVIGDYTRAKKDMYYALKSISALNARIQNQSAISNLKKSIENIIEHISTLEVKSL